MFEAEYHSDGGCESSSSRGVADLEVSGSMVSGRMLSRGLSLGQEALSDRVI